ncbi:restriction endonuclease subunit S [Acidocella facilis]|uniref:restriction endonuclease subunit S n=1 Tax=Acidocella facilis TaxID=525 RepID=UPI001F37F576|nr:restriction endonuclease subunit S [Acidocella facilis]
MTQWPVIRMSDVCHEITVGHVGKMSDQYVSSGVPFLRSQDVCPGRIELSTVKFIPPSFHQKLRKSKLSPGDVVMVRTGYPGTAAVVPPSLLEANCADLVIARPGPKLDPHFLAYTMNSPLGRGFVRGSLVGVAQQHFNVKVAAGMKLPLPPLPIQRRIASILGAYDDLIEVNRRRIAVLEEMARRLFDEWFVNFRFPGHEGHALVETEHGSVPTTWPTVDAGSVIAFDPSTPVPRDGEKPFIPMTQLATMSSIIGSPEQRTGNSGSKFQNDDTLLARITPCLENGKTGLVRRLSSPGGIGFGSTEFIVMRQKLVGRAFIYCLARSPRFRGHAIKSMSGATGRQRVRVESLKQFQLALPPSTLLSKFENAAWEWLEMVGVLAEANQRLSDSRDLLLPRLISGELSVATAERELEDAA